MHGLEVINKAAPYVETSLGFGRQFVQSFDSVPPGSGLYDWTGVCASLEKGRDFLTGVAPITVALSAAISGAVMCNAAGTQAAAMLWSATGDPDARVNQWASQNVLHFERLQTNRAHIDFIRQKLHELFPSSVTEFDQSLDEYTRAINGATHSSGAAIAMRNVLESLNGNILDLARRYSSRPSAIRKWDDAVLCIARGGPSSLEASQLLLEKQQYVGLHDVELTPIAKNDREPSRGEWEAIYAQFLGHLYTVLGLIEFKAGP